MARNQSAAGRMADVVLGLGTLPFAFILLFAVSRWSPRLTGDQWAFFYVLPAAVLAALGLALKQRESLRVNVALALFAVGGSLAFLQIAFAMVPTPSDGNAGNGPADRRSVVQITHDLRAEGTDAFPRLSAPEFLRVPLPSGGDSLQLLNPAPGAVTVVLCHEADMLVTYLSDAWGFNNPPADPANGADTNVLLIGDSFTHGLCVAPEDNIAGQLRSRFPGVRNLGVLGTGPLSQLGILREYGAGVRPPAVVWVYYEGNDLFDLAMEEARPYISRYADPQYTQGLSGHRELIDREMRDRIDGMLAAGAPLAQIAPPGLLARLTRTDSFRQFFHFGVLTPRRTSRIRSLPAVLAEAKRTAESWGGELILVYLPAYSRYHMWFGPGAAGYRDVVRTADSLGIAFVDMNAAFAELPNPKKMWTHPGGHLTVEGYGRVAQAVAPQIERVLTRQRGEIR